MVKVVQHTLRFFAFAVIGQAVKVGEELTHLVVALRCVEDPLEDGIAVVPLGRDRLGNLPNTVLPGCEQANVAGLNAGDDSAASAW